MTVVPNTVALASIAPGSEITSADHRNNYAAIQSAINQLIADLSSGSAGQVLRALSSTSVGWDSTPFITSSALSGGPPGSPVDGQIWIATGVDANGTVWQFRYNSGSASTYKWEFIGGAALSSFTTPGVVINALGTQVGATGFYYSAAMSYTAVRAGEYAVGATGVFDPNGTGVLITSAAFMGTTVPTGGAANQTPTGTAGQFLTNAFVPQVVTVTPAGTVIGVAHNSSALAATKLTQCGLTILPRRII